MQRIRILSLLLSLLLLGCVVSVEPEEPTATATAPAETQTESLVCEHTWTQATCTEPKTCTRCGLTDGMALGHDWTGATCTEPKTCTRCGVTDGEALGHDWLVTGCLEPCVCARCGVSGEAPGHDWIEARCTYPKHCARCGMIEGEAPGHVLENGVCTRCGFTEFAPITGEQDAVVGDVRTGDGIYRIHVRNGGGGTFTVWAYDADGTADLIALGRGQYDGTVLLFGSAPYTFEVFSTAKWSLTVEQLDETTERRFSGKGDAVTDLFSGASGAFRFTHSGEGDFVVWLYTTDGEQLLVRELGACKTEAAVTIPQGSRAFFAVRADGAWTIEPME